MYGITEQDWIAILDHERRWLEPNPELVREEEDDDETL